MSSRCSQSPPQAKSSALKRSTINGSRCPIWPIGFSGQLMSTAIPHVWSDSVVPPLLSLAACVPKDHRPLGRRCIELAFPPFSIADSAAVKLGTSNRWMHFLPTIGSSTTTRFLIPKPLVMLIAPLVELATRRYSIFPNISATSFIVCGISGLGVLGLVTSSIIGLFTCSTF